MSEPDPLFDMHGPVNTELARLERELGRLRWRPRELPDEALAASGVLASIDAASKPRESSSRESSSRPRWPHPRVLPWLAGLVSAAAVLALTFAMRPTPPDAEPERVPAPAIQPAGSPPDIADPFEVPREADAPELELVPLDPFTMRQNAKTPTAPTHSDLIDPFEADRDASWNAPSAAPQRPTPHLIDPFTRNPAADTQPDLRDPFAERSSSSTGPTSPAADVPGSRSPDLVDPFARPH